MTPGKDYGGGGSKSGRREARELALRMLFEIEVGHQRPDDVLAAAFAQSALSDTGKEFAEELVRGTLSHQAELDRHVAALSHEWALDRQAAVDRNILRLSAFELLYRPDTPVASVVNEAVELAKKYSTAESGRFVNGVLGALARQPRGDAETEESVSDDARRQ